jgi:5'-phosphate synthase pdxT subunit
MHGGQSQSIRSCSATTTTTTTPTTTLHHTMDATAPPPAAAAATSAAAAAAAAPATPPTAPIRIGVLALQGSFREHMALLQRCNDALPAGDPRPVVPVEVRTKVDLDGVVALIVPGGESTTMALVAARWGLLPELRAFSRSGRPVWGTCAGMIFLAERAERTKQGGQELMGGLDITVSRNFFGAQQNSFERAIEAPEALRAFGGGDTFRGVFIRAPVVLEAGPGVEVLARCPVDGDGEAQEGGGGGGGAAAAAAAGTKTQQQRAAGQREVIVGVRAGPLMATAFHPELTSDVRWHQLFVQMVRDWQRQAPGGAEAVAAAAAAAEAAKARGARALPAATAPSEVLYMAAAHRPGDLPVYGTEFLSRG